MDLASREVRGRLHLGTANLTAGGDVSPAHGSRRRSLAFHAIYRDPKATTDPENAKTLTDEEVDKRHAAVVASVKERFGAVL